MILGFKPVSVFTSRPVFGENELVYVAKTDKEKSLAAGSSMEDGNNGEVKKLIGAAHSACPELFLPDGGVDVYRVASR